MVFSSVYVIDATCFDECFLFHVISGTRYFSKSLSLLWDFFNQMFFFETNVLKEVRALRYLHNNSAVLILMLMLSSKIKLSYTILTHTWKTFVADFFYDNVFCTLYFWLFHTFLYKSECLPDNCPLDGCPLPPIAVSRTIPPEKNCPRGKLPLG